MFFNFFKEKVLILLNLYFIMGKRRSIFNPNKVTTEGMFRKSAAAGGSRQRIRKYVPSVVQRIAVPRGTKIPFRVGTKEFRLAQELRRIAGTKVSPSQSKADVYAVLASLRKKSSLRYLKKSDVFIGRDVEAVFKTLVENKVIIYSPLGIKK